MKAALLPLFAAFMLHAADTFAYCVYNKSKGHISVHGPGPEHGMFHPRFSKELGPGQSACCPHDNRDCNPTRQADATVYLSVTYNAGKTLSCSPKPGMSYTALNANGYLVIDNNYLSAPHVARVLAYRKDHALRERVFCPGAS